MNNILPSIFTFFMERCFQLETVNTQGTIRAGVAPACGTIVELSGIK